MHIQCDDVGVVYGDGTHGFEWSPDDAWFDRYEDYDDADDADDYDNNERFYDTRPKHDPETTD